MRPRVAVVAVAVCVALGGAARAAEPVLVKDINQGSADALPVSLVDLGGGVLLFGANDGAHGAELWKSDGTAAGTAMVADINTAATTELPVPPSFPAGLVRLGSAVFFTAIPEGQSCAELFKTDGTAQGTVKLTSGCPDADMRYGDGYAVVGTKLFFAGSTAADGSELWISDGTGAGTREVIDLNAGSGAGMANSRPPAALGGKLIFPGNDGNGEEPWISDGTAVGTTMLSDTMAGTTTSAVAGLTTVGARVYFFQSGSDPRRLWQTDGTAAATTPLARFGGSWLFPAALGSTVIFVGADATSGVEPWKTDGTAAGSARLRDISAGTGTSSPRRFVVSGGVMYFSANDGAAGAELWKTDGTEAGTVMVADIAPGAPSSSPDFLTDVRGTLYFVASDGTHGFELWKSDGTAPGTTMVADTVAGAAGAFDTPATFRPQLVVAGDRLFFQAHDDRGTELWALELGAPTPAEPGADGGAPADGGGADGAASDGGAGGGGMDAAASDAPATDAASPGDGPSLTGAAGSGGGTGGGGGGSGCGCRAAEGTGALPPLLLALAALALSARARRRRPRRG